MSQTAVENWIAAQREPLLERLTQLAAINSGTANVAGVNRIGAEFAALFEPLCDSRELLPSASAQRASIAGEMVTEHYGDIQSFVKRPEAAIQVLLVGHLDTVFPVDHHFQQPQILDDARLGGPGVADMKGGILVMLTALQAFEQLPQSKNLGWRVILNADEETGSLGSAAVLEAAARQAHAGLIYEPAMADGTFSRARKGSGNFTLIARGLAAHAGREFTKGRNAILLLSRAIDSVAALTDVAQGITVNVARISGGSAFNVVPDTAVGQFNIRCQSPAQQKQLAQQLHDIVSTLDGSDGVSLSLSGQFTRPPKVLSAANRLLMDWTVELGESLQMQISFKDTGGCCDGNNLANAGLPNIDTLGVAGAHIHTDQEFMLMDSLTERAQLSLRLLDRLAREGEQLLTLKQAG